MEDINRILRLEAYHHHMRDQHRLKLGCDYAITSEYGELHLLCAKVFAENLVEQALAFGITFTTIHTY